MFSIVNLLSCPVCKCELHIEKDYLVCNCCQTVYEIVEGIPHLLPSILDKDIEDTISSWENIKFDYNAYIEESSNNRLQAIDKPLLEQCHVGKKVLEVGCGTARLGKEVEEIGSDYFGIDPSLKMLMTSDIKDNLILGVGEYLPFPTNSFDTIIGGYHSFRYINLDKAYGEFSRVLKPGGTLAFTLWNYWRLKIYAYMNKVKELKISLSEGSSPEVDLICNDVSWPGNEINRLKEFNFEVINLLSTQNLPLPNSRGWKGYWHGRIGALFGYDLIFICKNKK